MAARYKKIVFADGSMMDLHRHLMEKHLGRKLTEDEVVHHINEDPRDNRIENLQVMTRREHAQHHLKGKPGHPNAPHIRAAIRARMAGEQTHFHKLTEIQVIEIRRRAKAGETHQSIANAFGVSRPTISRAISGKHWWCVPMNGSQLTTP